jgi:hypothetical protein
MLIGDTHGGVDNILPKLDVAGKLKIQHVLQVGDFGLWSHYQDGQVYLDMVQASAQKNKLSVYAIGGNHENWDHWEWMTKNLPTHKNFAMVRSRVLLSPKINNWRWDNKQFISAGGAVSVDREWRLQREAGVAMDEYGRIAKATGPRTMYWPNEELTDQDVHKLKTWGIDADYLITHDCSNNTPWNGRLKADPQSETHRRRIDEVIRATNPGMHFHGHMHTKYDWLNFAGERNGEAIYVQTYGLEHDTSWYSWGILDTETDKFTWRDNTPEEGNDE